MAGGGGEAHSMKVCVKVNKNIRAKASDVSRETSGYEVSRGHRLAPPPSVRCTYA